MQFGAMAKILGDCLRHPVRSCRTVARALASDRAVGFAEGCGAAGGAAPGVSSPRPAPGNPLWEYFQANRKGPGIWKWTHYFDVYTRHLSKFVGRSPHVVEIGIYSGGSLGMWRQFFGPGCHVSGIDIEPACKSYAGDGVTIHIGDQADRGFWKAFREQSPPVDVLIDDGGHATEQQRITLEEMLPHLRPGGVYVCEDVCGTTNKFAAYAHKLADQLNGFEWVPLLEAEQRESDGDGSATPTNAFQRLVHSVHLYPWVVVIERNEQPPDRLFSPRHGTEWQPFL